MDFSQFITRSSDNLEDIHLFGISILHLGAIFIVIIILLFVLLPSSSYSSVTKQQLPPRSAALSWPPPAPKKEKTPKKLDNGENNTNDNVIKHPLMDDDNDPRSAHAADEILTCKRRFSFKVESKWQMIIDDIKPRFYEYINSGAESWDLITKTERTTVWKRKEGEFCYKIEGVLDATPGTIINLLFPVEDRPKWDNKIQEQRVVEQVSPMNRIIYVQTKPIWPCSARDMCLFSYLEKIDNGGILNVATRYDHPNAPEKEGVVRALAGITGQIFRRHPTLPGKTLMTQIADLDIRGSLPKNIVRIVTETVLPNTVSALNKQVIDKPVIEDWYPPGFGPNGRLNSTTTVLSPIIESPVAEKEKELSTADLIADREKAAQQIKDVEAIYKNLSKELNAAAAKWVEMSLEAKSLSSSLDSRLSDWREGSIKTEVLVRRLKEMSTRASALLPTKNTMPPSPKPTSEREREREDILKKRKVEKEKNSSSPVLLETPKEENNKDERRSKKVKEMDQHIKNIKETLVEFI